MPAGYTRDLATRTNTPVLATRTDQSAGGHYWAPLPPEEW